MKNIIKKKQLWLLGGLGLVSALPIAVAASCGSSSSTTAANLTKIQALKADLTASTHNNVVWEAKSLAGIKDASISSYEYYYPDKLITDLAVVTKEAKWVATLPKLVNADNKLRSLWVRITPADGYSTTTPILDLTQKSDIGKIKTSIDYLPEYANVNLSNLALEGTIDALTIKGESGTLPKGSKLVFKYNNADYTSDELGKKLIADKLALKLEDLRNIKARLDVTDTAAYVLAANKETLVSAAGIKLDALTSLPMEVYSVLNQYHVDMNATPAITNEAMKWVETPVLPADFASGVMYLSGNYPTRESFSAVPATSWKATLAEITSVAPVKGERHLWAKVTPAAGKTFTDAYYDMTMTSGVQGVPTLVNTNALALGMIKLMGSASEITVDDTAVTLPTGAMLEYSVDNGTTFKSLADFKQLIMTTPLTEATKATIKVRLAPMSTDYVITDAKMTMPDVTGIHITISPKVVADFVATIMVKAGVESTHDAIMWSDVTLPANDTVEKIEFLLGNYPTLKSTEGQTWVPNAIPTMSSYIASERHLWVHFVPYAGKVLNTEYQDLTVQSKIQSVKTKIDAGTDYAAANLEMIRISGTPTAVTFDESAVKAPMGTVFEYAIDGTNFKSQTEFNSIIATTPLTAATKATIKVRLALAPTATSYVLINGKVTSPNVTGIVIPEAVPAAVSAYVATIRANTDTSLFNDIKWTQAAFTPDSTVAKLGYLVGDFATKDLAQRATTWSDVIPTATDVYTPTARHFWIKYVPASGKAILPAEEYQDITSTSQIQMVKSKIDLHPKYVTANLGLVKIAGTPSLITIDDAAALATLPEGAILKYSLDGSTNWMSSTDFKNSITTTAPLTEATKATIRVHLEPSSPVYIFDNAKVSTPDVTGIVFTIAVPAEYSTTVVNVKAKTDATSTNDNVQWDNTAVRPITVKQFRYLYGSEYTTRPLAEAADDMLWKTELPKMIDYSHGSRHLWIKADPAVGYAFSASSVIDITPTSDVQAVKSRVDSTLEFAAIDLTRIVMTGVFNALVINDATITLPVGVRITYSNNGNNWSDKASFINGLSALIPTSTVYITGIQARLEVMDAALYVLDNNKLAHPNTDAITLPTV